MKKLITAVSLALSLSACVSYGTPIKWDSVRATHAGMTEKELLAVMGQPSSVSTRGTDTIYIYMFVSTSGSAYASFKLNDGIVTLAPTVPAGF